jgi:uncharacterized membrane-anchored protein YitT (DUF2179 family)
MARFGLILALGIPVIGIPVVLLTRLLAWLYQPQLFESTLPTISKTAAYAPASWLFTPGMAIVAIAIVLAWPISYLLNRREILRLVTSSTAAVRLGILNAMSMLFGIIAGLSLGGLAIIHLEVHDPTHMLLSKIFFGMMVLALLCDSLLARRLGKYALPTANVISNPAPAGMNLRYPICLMVSLSAIFFLFMFLTKDTGLIPHPMLVRWLYVGSETILCILLLLYSLSYLPLLRRVISESSANGEPYNIAMQEQIGGN